MLWRTANSILSEFTAYYDNEINWRDQLADVTLSGFELSHCSRGPVAHPVVLVWSRPLSSAPMQHQCSTNAAPMQHQCSTRLGVRNIVALRGDPPRGGDRFKAWSQRIQGNSRDQVGSRFWRIRKRSTHVKRLMLSDQFCVEYTFDSHITLWPSRAREMDRHGGRFQQCFRSGQASQPRRWC